jgi:hypothetical protein
MKLNPKWLEAFAILALTAMGLAVFYTSAKAETYDGACATQTGPCTAWDVSLPQEWEDNPTVILRRVWDGERPDEGELTVNGGCRTPLFGGLAAPSHDNAEVPQLSYEVLSSCWRPGSNRVAIRWLTNQSPSVHEIRGGLAVAVRLPPPPVAHPPAGCRLASIQPTADYWMTRLLRGCSDGRGGLTTEVAVLAPQTVRDLGTIGRTLLQNAPLAPRPIPALVFGPSDSQLDRCALWPEAEGC